MQKIHRMLGAMAWTVLLISLFRMILSYGSLPQEIGVHFGSDGQFDVIANKIYAFYPIIVSFIVVILGELAAYAVGKVKAGMKISLRGQNQLRAVILIFIHVLKIGVLIFFSIMWTNCVIKQVPMNTLYATLLAWMLLGSILAFLIAVVVIRVKNPKAE